MKKLLLGAATLIALAAPAVAADIPARTYSRAPAYTAPAVVYNWTGFYIGGHVGGAFAGDNSLQSSDARFMGGVQGGFDYQFSQNWVIGAEIFEFGFTATKPLPNWSPSLIFINQASYSAPL